jgi:formate-dependent nitrite reductase membrane component NrfD
MAGAAQLIATTADLADRQRYRRSVRNGRFLAVAGAALGAPLLIADLHTPQRFYNMLRIFRPTSPMSIGTYVLTSFGAFSTALAVMELRRGETGGPSTSERALEIPAATAGAAMSTYTGALLCATSTPLWAAAPRLIPALFGASAMASAAAALSLAARDSEAEVLGRIEAAASAVELLLLLALRRRLRAVGVRTRFGIAPLLLTAAAPLAHQVANALERPRESGGATERRAESLGKLASAAVLAGAFLLRHLILTAGNRSAERPRDYFRFAGPR